MKIIICLAISISAVAKEPQKSPKAKAEAAAKTESLRVKKETPNHDQSIDMNSLKDVKLKQQDGAISVKANCESVGGKIYEPGTVGYESCMKEQDIYVPTGSEHKTK